VVVVTVGGGGNVTVVWKAESAWNLPPFTAKSP